MGKFVHTNAGRKNNYNRHHNSILLTQLFGCSSTSTNLSNSSNLSTSSKPSTSSSHATSSSSLSPIEAEALSTGIVAWTDLLDTSKVFLILIPTSKPRLLTLNCQKP